MKVKTILRQFASKLDEAFASSAPTSVSGLLEKRLIRGRKSYSSFGEDLIVESIFRRHEFATKEILNFSYIDVGAWRPIRGSNTYNFYKQGIRGTVVEPNSNLFKVWRSLRPLDLLLPFACSTEKEVVFHQFTKLAPSNTANPVFAEEISLNQKIKIAKKSKVDAITLDEIIKRHLDMFPGTFILDIDIEGDDGKVLEDFSFALSSRPILILIEDHTKPTLELSPIHKKLSSNNYNLVARSIITSIYIDSHSTLINSQYSIL